MKYKYLCIFVCCYDCKRYQDFILLTEDQNPGYEIGLHYHDFESDVYDCYDYCYVYDIQDNCKLIKEGCVGDLVYGFN